MPPKPLAEDLARKRAERDKAKLGYATPKKDDGGGWGWFGDLVANPLDTAKGVGQAAKSNLYDPVNRAQKALNPFEDLTPMQRATGIAEGALVAADFLTPGVPEGSIARSLQREAMEKALDREVARYAASGGGSKYRGRLILHGSTQPNLKMIEARTGSFALPDTKAAYGVDLSEALSDELGQMDPRDWSRRITEVGKYSRDRHRVAPGAPLDPYGSFYVGRVPEGNRIARQLLPEDSVKIAPDRFDDYVVSSADVPVLAEARPQAYIDMDDYAVPRSQRLQGPSVPRRRQDYEGEYFSVLGPEESAVFDLLDRAPLRPSEKRQLAEMLRRRFEMNKIGPEDWE